MNQDRLIKFLWVVIGVLVIGMASVTAIAYNRAHAIDQARSSAQGSIDSLKEQVRQAKLTHSPEPTPLPEASSNLATPTPKTPAKP